MILTAKESRRLALKVQGMSADERWAFATEVLKREREPSSMTGLDAMPDDSPE